MAEQNLAIQILQTIIGLLGICGNGLVCVVIIKVHFMHTITNAFIFNQSLIDLLASLLFLLYNVIPIPKPIPPGVTGVLLCSLWVSEYFVWMFFYMSTFNLVALTLERYLAIVFPFRYQVLGTRRNVIVTILCVWVFASLFNLTEMFLYHYENGKCKRNVMAHSVVYDTVTFIVMYLLPVIIMLVVYIHIMVVLKNGASRIGPAPAAAVAPRGGGAVDNQRESLMRARRNTFKTLLLVFITFTICWTPCQITLFLFHIGFDVDFESAIYIILVVMVASNSCLNPFIYSIKYKQFRKALKTLFRGRAVIVDESPLATISNGHG